MVNGVTVALPEETREDGPAHGLFHLAQPMGGRLSDLVEERSLVVVAQPREVTCKNARLLDQPELPDGDPHRFHRRVAGVGLDRLDRRHGLAVPHDEERVEPARHSARHVLHHTVNDAVPGTLALFAHEASDGGLARAQDELLREERLGALMEGRRLLEARGRVKHECHEPLPLLGREVTETSVARDPLLGFGDRLASPSVLIDEIRGDPELHPGEQ